MTAVDPKATFRGPTPGERLDRALETLRSSGRVGIMTHIVLGYPSVEESYRIVDCMVQSGVDIIEVQIPFSDPTADGPVITAACQSALDGGVRVADAFTFMKEVTSRYDVPFLFMSYLNIAFAYRGGVNASDKKNTGLRAFVGEAAAVGACGLILPDIPPEQTQERYPENCRDFGVHPIYVVSPNATEKRLQMIGQVASGLIYATSRTGTTGREMQLELERLTLFLQQARDICKLPLAVGFSISGRQQIEALRGHADVAVIGTHLIRAYEKDGVDGVRKELGELVG